MNKVFLVSFKLPTDYMGNVLQVWLTLLFSMKTWRKLKELMIMSIPQIDFFTYQQVGKKKN